MSNLYYETELYHYGVLGMKWGKRKSNPGYRSTGIRAARARRANEKVDKSFKKWEENSKKKTEAIDLGKKANLAKMAYEKDRSNKSLKDSYKQANKEYKKALNKNTEYRKGSVRSEVGKDLSRKYLSEAKKVKKQLDNNPSDKTLQKKYNDLMSKHDIERDKARRAQEVGAKRSQKVASIKRGMTMSAKAVAGTAAVAAGTYAVNRYLNNHLVVVGGKVITGLKASSLGEIVGVAKKAKDLMGFMW